MRKIKELCWSLLPSEQACSQGQAIGDPLVPHGQILGEQSETKKINRVLVLSQTGKPWRLRELAMIKIE